MRMHSRCGQIQSQKDQEYNDNDDDNNDGLFLVSADNTSIICKRLSIWHSYFLIHWQIPECKSNAL